MSPEIRKLSLNLASAAASRPPHTHAGRHPPMSPEIRKLSLLHAVLSYGIPAVLLGLAIGAVVALGSDMLINWLERLP